MTDTVTAIMQGDYVEKNIFCRMDEFDELRCKLAKMLPCAAKSELRYEIRKMYAGQKKGH